MAHTNQTSNYGLSQFEGTDKPAWLVDYNGDMEKIDLGIKTSKDVADAAKAEADQGALDIAAVTITANSADAKATGAVSDLSDAYDSTSTYNVGDFVIYNNILYRCITAITVPESFDGTHWARTTVEEIITQINADLSDKADRITRSYGDHTLTIDANTMREYTFPEFSEIPGSKIVAQYPVIVENGQGITVGRDVDRNYTIRIWNNSGSSKNVRILYYVTYYAV